MIPWFCLLLFVQSTIGKKGLIQEILQVDKTGTDVIASTRSLLGNGKAVHFNQIDNFDAVAKQDQKYVQKVRGFFKAPETGEYKFYSSCSGPCEIYIGQENSLKPRKIISQKEESLHNEFNRYPDQVSHTIYLEKDKLYFIQGVEKQNGGLGHLSVGVVLPSDKQVFPISKSYLRTDTQSDVNRKQEISRDSKAVLTNQRDTMFKKLREINDYIQNLTDEVKRKSTAQNEDRNSGQYSLASDSSKESVENVGLSIGNEDQTIGKSDEVLEKNNGKKAVANGDTGVGQNYAKDERLQGTANQQLMLKNDGRNQDSQDLDQKNKKGETEENGNLQERFQKQRTSQANGEATEGTNKENTEGNGRTYQDNNNKERLETTYKNDKDAEKIMLIQSKDEGTNKAKASDTEQMKAENTKLGSTERNEQREKQSASISPEVTEIQFQPATTSNNKILDEKLARHNYPLNEETNAKANDRVGKQQKSIQEPTVIAVIEKSMSKPQRFQSPDDVKYKSEGINDAYESSKMHKQEPEKKELLGDDNIHLLSSPSGSIQHQTDVNRADQMEGIQHDSTNIPQTLHGLLHNKHDINPSTNVVLEHGYFKLHKSGQEIPVIHADDAISLHPEKQDDEDVMQLTNYAKQEIAKHGNLSESVIKHLVRIIKQKILSEGIMAFNKRQNTSVMLRNNEKNRNLENDPESKASSGKDSAKDSAQWKNKQTGKDTSAQISKGNVDIYDHVVSNLMKSLKKNLLSQKSTRKAQATDKEHEIQDQNIDLKLQSDLRPDMKMLTDESTSRNNRILASLNHLSSELERVKSFLRTNEESATSEGAQLKDAPQITSLSNITPIEANTEIDRASLVTAIGKQQIEENKQPLTKNGTGMEIDDGGKHATKQIIEEHQVEQQGSRKDANPLQFSDEVSQDVTPRDNSNSHFGHSVNVETTEGNDPIVQDARSRQGVLKGGFEGSLPSKDILDNAIPSTGNRNVMLQTNAAGSTKGLIPSGTKEVGSFYSANSPNFQQSSNMNDKEENSIDKELDRALGPDGIAEAILSPNSYQSMLLKTVSNENNYDQAEENGKIEQQNEGGSIRRNGALNENDVSKSMIDSTDMKEMGSPKPDKQKYDANSLMHQLNSARILGKLKSPTDQSYYTQLLENTVDQIMTDAPNSPMTQNKERQAITMKPNKAIKQNLRETNSRSMIRKSDTGRKNNNYTDTEASKKTEIIKYNIRKSKRSKKNAKKREKLKGWTRRSMKETHRNINM